jgi:hypothetical protein
MPPPYIDPTKPLPDPSTLPRGLITPPPEVREAIARDKVRRALYYTPEYEALVLNDQTLAWYFAHQLVAYRPTPEGPEVLAVGDEIEEFVKKTPPDQRPGVILKQP